MMARPPDFRHIRHSPPAALVAMQLISQIMSLSEKPPVTIGLIAFQCLLYFSPETLKRILHANGIRPPSWLTNVRSACLQPVAVLGRREWHRLITATITHLSDIHVLWNMTSLLMKGVILERHLGSIRFSALVIFLGVFAHALYLGIAWGMWHFTGRNDWMRTCVAGFSGVLFGLKVILNSKEFAALGYAHDTRILGIRFPAGQAHWAELIGAQVVTPNASFLGHLCGILAGILCVRGGRVARLCWHMRETVWSNLGFKGPRYEYFGGGMLGTRGQGNGNQNG